jgi:hypothetical protein
MGFFCYAYIIEGEVNHDGVSLSVSAYSCGGPLLFSWGQGVRAPGLEPLAHGTLFCEEHLKPLPGYPRLDQRQDPENSLYIEESFFPPRREEPVLFHVLLPRRYVLMPDRKPFTLSSEANIALKDNRLFFTWPTVGGADLRFWIKQLADNEVFADYDLGQLLKPSVERSPKLSFELNFGIAKLKVE